MAIRFTRVQPGDLIIAEQWNLLLEEVEKLGDRVAYLEQLGQGQTGAVTIFGISPQGPYHVGDRIAVIGRNFATPATNNVVMIDTTRVVSFRFGSSENQLVFDIPEVPGLPSGGRVVPLQVSNANGSASFDFNLEPRPIVPTGRVEVLYTDPPVMPFDEPDIAAGSAYVFTFSLTAFVTLQGTYRISVGMNQAGWSAELLEGASDDRASSNIITLPGDPSGVTRNIRVRVNAPNLADGAAATLSVAVSETSTGTAVTPGSAEIDITIGNPPPTPEDRVRISLRSVTNASIVNGRVVFERDTAGAMTFNLTFTEDGEYSFAPALRAPAGWQIDALSIPGVEIASAPANQDVTVILTPGSAAQSTDFLLSVTSSDTAPPVSVRYAQPVGAS